MKQKGKKILARNRKARHEFFIEDTIEAGIVLKGVEVKSIRQGKVNLKESYGVVDRGEVFLYGCHISPYEQGNIQNVNPLRKRKLLLHKREIKKLEEAINLKGLTLIPLSMYLRDGNIKVELAIIGLDKCVEKQIWGRIWFRRRCGIKSSESLTPINVKSGNKRYDNNNYAFAA